MTVFATSVFTVLSGLFSMGKLYRLHCQHTPLCLIVVNLPGGKKITRKQFEKNVDVAKN